MIPSAFISGYIGAANYVGKLHYSNIWEYRGDFSKTIGRHTFRLGASLATDGWEQPFYGSKMILTLRKPPTVTAMGAMPWLPCSGVPTYAEVDNVYSLLHGGKIIGTYFQDQWRVNDRLTINWGLRYDITINPRQGKAPMAATLPATSTSATAPTFFRIRLRHAPRLKARRASREERCLHHVTIAKNGKINNDNYDNFQPRIGFAYRL